MAQNPDSANPNYDHKNIEQKWQEKWAADGTYATKENATAPKQYILDMFPYPSGEGLHVGHPRGYLATDVYSRMKRMQGFNVLHPMGWDAFGLPAENFAIKNKIHPRVAVEKNIARFKGQLSIMGPDYDWSREINTTDPKFYKWTQWIFLQMYKKGLAYESYEPINWCPGCQTGLANEDVEADGTCERCGSKVEKKPMRQWVLKITDYADRMLADLDKLPKWPEGIKEAQRHWIGRSVGAEIDFPVPGQPEHPIKVFTTRADTIFGATFIAVSAGLAKEWLGMGWKASDEIKEYILKTEQEQAKGDFKEREKTGIYAGFDVTNPATKESIPVWIANYVMKDFGTGAIMAVPAHDQRDFDFAKKFNLPIKQVIARETGHKKENEEFRNGGAAVVFDPDKQLYAVALHENGKPLLFAGGVNDGESVHDTIIREVQEESGLYDFKEIKWIETSYAHYFNTAKKVNRVARAECLAIVLGSTKTKEVHLESHEKFTLGWMTAEQIRTWWEAHDDEDGFKHYIRFLNESVAWFIQEKYDTTSDPKKFVSTPISEYGILENSEKFNGLTSEEAKQKIIEFVGGKTVTKYRIKDWVFSRQRYWGEPIPIIHCEKCGLVPVPEKDLPVLLPEVESYEPAGTGESPLATITDWVNITCPTCGGPAKRETNTMPQWAGSSWYYLRFIDPNNTETLIAPEKEKQWMPVDVYVGGDHATRHLIYARFWHKFLYDIGVVSTEEPFPRLEFLGYILAEDGRKMSKRWGNVINPDDVIKTFGADAFRLYEMFIGPFESTVPWSTDGLVGTRRFIERVWRAQYIVNENESSDDVVRTLHKAIKKVGEDIASFKFNTAVSTLMICVNAIEKAGAIHSNDYKTLLQLLAPFAPHMTEELWYALGETTSIHLSSWPTYNESLIADETIVIAVQVNGKVRDTISIAPDESEEDTKTKALSSEKIQAYIAANGTTSAIKKIIVVPGKIVNIVI